MSAKIYALYKGEKLLDTGTVHQIAQRKNVQRATIHYYATPRYQKRSNEGNRLCLILLED